ncbi:DUF2933 domain-containing protein [Shimia litoralis]|uniref:DUF2933 domain-containing protein n=3 Tax=Shimia TaxID=573139 RepID=A0A4U7MSU2_9RHOB|nr:DUF2933 domain-containing protein [Shimia litoralis]TKZ15873.1 DUF2933 domain-containing protein [Shimia litoralis]
MSKASDTKMGAGSQSGPKIMHFAMMACCVVMLLPIAGFLLAGGTIGGLASNLWAFAPLLLCVGAHLVMHKMMGKSCHKSNSQGETENPNEAIRGKASTVPQVRRG